MNSEKYIGLDVHQATISVAVLDSTGKLVMESILETKAATILEFFAGCAELCRSPSKKELGSLHTTWGRVPGPEILPDRQWSASKHNA